MRNCRICDKKLGIFGGLTDFDGDICKKCSDNPKKIKEKELEEAKESEKEEKEIKVEKEKKKVSNGSRDNFMFQIILVLIIIAIGTFFWSSFFDSGDTERCLEQCVYDNEHCPNEVDIGGTDYVTVREYNSCNRRLEACVWECRG